MKLLSCLFFLLFFIGYSHSLFAQAIDNQSPEALYEMAKSLLDQQQWKEAEAISRKGLKRLTPKIAAEKAALKISFYNLLGDCALDQSRYIEAIKHYTTAEALVDVEGQENSLIAAEVYNKIANHFREIKDCENAQIYLQKALAIRLELLGKLDLKVADVYNNMGNCWAASGDFEKALSFHQQALSIRKTKLEAPHPDLAQSYNNIGMSLVDKGDYEKALLHFKDAFGNYIEHYEEDHPDIADVFINMGDAYAKLGDMDFFLEYQKGALAIYQKTLDPTHSSIAICYNNLANAYSAKGDFEKAASYYQLALTIRKKKYGKQHADVAESLNNIAQTANLSGNWEMAIASFEACFEALAYSPTAENKFEASNNHQVLLNAFMGISESYIGVYQGASNEQDLAKAYAYLNQASALIDFLRIRFEAIGSKLKLFENAHRIYDWAIELALVLKEIKGDESFAEQAFGFAEKSKALLLLEALKKSEAEQFAGIPADQINRINDLEKEIAQLEKFRFLELENPNTSTSSVDSLGQLIFDQKTALSKQIQGLEKNYPDYYQLRYATATVPIDWIQKELLEDDQTIVEYFLGETRLHFFIINKNSFTVRTIDLPQGFEQWLHVFNLSIRNFNQVASKELDKNMTQYAKAAHLLYRALINPIEDLLESQLIIIPDGALGLLPFEALLSEYPAQVQHFKSHPYLIKKYRFSYNYSITLLKEMQERVHRSTSKNYLGFAPSFEADNAYGLSQLRYTETEINKVQAMIGGTLYTGQNATKANFLAQQADYQILHLATHGKVNTEVGDYSFLAFSEPAQQQTGEEALLYVKDIYSTPTRANLVVLSACETGIGALQKGEGIASIARSFSYAGAKSLLATQWSVDDKATNELIDLFFQNIKKGLSKDAALQASKLTFIESKGDHKAHPYYWASFISIGSRAPLDLRVRGLIGFGDWAECWPWVWWFILGDLFGGDSLFGFRQMFFLTLIYAVLLCFYSLRSWTKFYFSG